MNSTADAVYQLVDLFGPILVCIVGLQFIEDRLQRRLTRYFGWKSNLITGWIGAPIHEYSHAIMAKLFGMEVREIVPFRPEPKTGRLGYVSIQHDPQSTWHALGQFFVCYAPLAGGTAAILVLTLLFYPQAVRAEFNVEPQTLVHTSLSQALDRIGMIMTLDHFASLRFWIFSYLILCIGSHLAPSSVDFSSSTRGHKIVGLILVAALVVFLAVGGLPAVVLSTIAPGFLILQANLLFSLLLCLSLYLIVYIITEMIKWLS